MKNKKLISAFVAIIAAFLAIYVLYRDRASEGKKEVIVNVISIRDDYSEEHKYTTSLEYLGELLKEEKLVEYEDSEYGMYIRGVDGLLDDTNEQYWWCIYVNKEAAVNGADSIVLKDGDIYTLELKQGY